MPPEPKRPAPRSIAGHGHVPAGGQGGARKGGKRNGKGLARAAPPMTWGKPLGAPTSETSNGGAEAMGLKPCFFATAPFSELATSSVSESPWSEGAKARREGGGGGGGGALEDQGIDPPALAAWLVAPVGDVSLLRAGGAGGSGIRVASWRLCLEPVSAASTTTEGPPRMMRTS